MKVTFDAKDFEDLASQIFGFLAQSGRIVQHQQAQEVYEAELRHMGESVNDVQQDAPEEEPATMQEPKKARGRPRKEPLPVVDDEPAQEEVALDDEKEVEAPFTASSGSPSAAELLKIKEETLKRLKDLFIAGKGARIRELLKRHGHGALVFPEVEAKWFPAIKAEIDRELN